MNGTYEAETEVKIHPFPHSFPASIPFYFNFTYPKCFFNIVHEFPKISGGGGRVGEWEMLMLN